MKVSVCTSVLNQSEMLKGMIASVIGQSFSDWELIVIDDGSTEDIKSVCDDWNDERIHYHRFDENKRGRFNDAFRLAQGEYISILAADERLDLNKFVWQVGYLDEHPEIGAIWGLPQNGPLGERPEWEQYALKAHNRSNAAWIRTLLNVDSIPIGGASMLVRRAVMEDLNYYDTQFYCCADLEFFIRFFQKYQGRVLPYRWATCVDNPTSMSNSTRPEDFQADLARVRAKHALVLPPTTGRVSVAIPVRNMAQYVGDAIQSVLDQTFQDFELIVCDDASDDDGATLAAIQKFDDPRIKLIQFDENRGVAQAQNQMLAMAQGEFFMVFAADDKLETTALERLLAEFTKAPFLEFVATQTDFIDAAGAPVTAHPFLQIQKAANKPREQWLHQLWYGNNYFGVGLYRRQALLDVGGWDVNVGVICDYGVYLALLQRENIQIIEEPLTHTRIHDAQRSMLKGREAQFKLRADYHALKSRFYPPRMKVIIATPFYEMRGFSPYIVSMTQTIQLLTRMNIEHEFWELSGDSYVDRAKNTLFNKFLEDPAATDLFMIDSDMQWNAQSVINMLHFPEDIVQASYPQKNAWETWTARPLLVEHEGRQEPVGRMLPDGSALIKAEYLAGGFIRVKRPALEKYRDSYPEYVYHDAGADPSYPERLYTEFFTCERAKNEGGMSLRWGEDRVFGRRMMAIGVESWIYPNVDMGHYGIKGWIGNYDTYLRQPPPPEIKAA